MIGITERQAETLALLAQGLSLKQTALELGIPARTVAYEKYRLMNAHGLRTDDDLISFAARLGLLDSPADCQTMQSSSQISRERCGEHLMQLGAVLCRSDDLQNR